MARIKGQEITRRTVIQSRNSDAPDLRVQADLDSSRGHSAISLAAVEAFGKLGAVASRVRQDRAIKKNDEDTTQGQKDRFTETANGAPAQDAAALSERTEGYRRGYFLTEGLNRVNDAKLAIAKEVAMLRPGESADPIVQKHLGTLLEAPEFQDPAILKQLQPTLMELQQGVAAYHQKVELAEIFDSQQENLRGLARAGVQDGSLLTPEGVTKFRQALDTEQFAHLSQDEADDILSNAYVDLIESGQIDPEVAKAALQKPIAGDASALWDRGEWGEKFETAVAAGSAVRARAFEEKQAETLAGMEYQLQGRAARGQLSIGDINKIADQAGLGGKDRLSFVRRWIDQNDAGLKHMQSEARRAAEHRETIAAITAGNALSMTDSRLSKSAEKEWANAVASGDQKKRGEVIMRYTRAGIVIPQLKDLLGRTTASNLTANYNLYAELAKLDPIVADRYLSDENAVLFDRHHANITQFGMTPQESLQALPTGANKARRPEVASAISTASARYFKDNPALPNGATRAPAVAARIQQEAIRLGVANPNATPEDNLRVAERRVMSDLIEVNGRTVPRGGARPAAAPAITTFVREGADELVAMGALSKDSARGVYAAPLPANPNRFVMLLPNGFPVANPRTGKPITFDPLEIAQARQEYDSQRREAETRRRQETNQRLRQAPAPVNYGAVDTPGALEQMAEGQAEAVRKAAEGAETKPFPGFMQFLQDHRATRKGN
jgi:hypothetical protein